MKPASRRSGFTLIEVTAAAVILVIISASIMTIMNNCIENVIDNESKLKAFKIARENMESLLGKTTVSEMIVFGSPEDNSDIEWELAVEAFTEPINNEMWIRAVSTASFTASSGDREYIELTHWLTDLTESQIQQIKNQRKLEEEYMDETLVNPYGDDAEGLLMFQDSLTSDGRFAAAAKITIQLMQKFPSSFQAEEAAAKARILARRFAHKGNYAIAAEISLAIAKAFPETQRADQALDDAMKYANGAAQDGYYKDAADIAKRIAEETPDSKKAQKALERIYDYAKLAAEKGDYDSALGIIEDIKNNHPELTPPAIVTQAIPRWIELAPEQVMPPKTLPTLDDPITTNPDPDRENPQDNEPPEQKPPLTQSQVDQVKKDYNNNSLSISDLMRMSREGQITDAQLFEIIMSPLSQ